MRLSIASEATAGAWERLRMGFIRQKGNYLWNWVMYETLCSYGWNRGGWPHPVLWGTCSCQLGSLLFMYNPVQISYLPCCGPEKGHSLLTLYRFAGLFNVGHGKNFYFLQLSRSFSYTTIPNLWSLSKVGWKNELGNCGLNVNCKLGWRSLGDIFSIKASSWCHCMGLIMNIRCKTQSATFVFFLFVHDE